MFRILATVFLFRFCIIASPIVGMFSAFMLEKENSSMQMALVFVCFMVAMNLFEVPSSVIADKFSRKMVIISAIVAVFSSNVIFLFSQEHWAFIFHMIIAGIGFALFSGTVEAFAYDELKDINQTQFYQKILGAWHIAFSLGLSTSLFLSAWLVQFGWHVIIHASLFMCFLSLIIFIFGAKETKRIKKIDEPHSMKEILFEGGGVIIKNKIIQHLAIASIIFGAINAVFGDVAIITSIELGWEKAEIARFFGLNTIWEAVITMLFIKYCKNMQVNTVKWILTFALTVACLGMLFAQQWSIFFVLPIWWMDRLKNMVIDPKIQENAPSSSRATVSSCVNIIYGGKYIVLMLLMGLIAKFYSFSTGFVVICLVGIIQYLVFFAIMHKPKKRYQHLA